MILHTEWKRLHFIEIPSQGFIGWLRSNRKGLYENG